MFLLLLLFLFDFEFPTPNVPRTYIIQKGSNFEINFRLHYPII